MRTIFFPHIVTVEHRYHFHKNRLETKYIAVWGKLLLKKRFSGELCLSLRFFRFGKLLFQVTATLAGVLCYASFLTKRFGNVGFAGLVLGYDPYLAHGLHKQTGHGEEYEEGTEHGNVRWRKSTRQNGVSANYPISGVPDFPATFAAVSSLLIFFIKRIRFYVT